VHAEAVERESASAWRVVGSAAGILLLAVLFAFVGILWALLPRDAPIEPFLIALMGAAAFALLVAVGLALRARLTRQGLGDTSARRHL
jgi:hypothetical protein